MDSYIRRELKYKLEIQRLEERITDRAETNPMDQVRDLTVKVQESASKLVNQKGQLEQGTKEITNVSNE